MNYQDHNFLKGKGKHGQLKLRHQLTRLIWNILWKTTTCLLPARYGGWYKRLILRLFGAKIDSTALIYSSAGIYYPANLVMKSHSVLGPSVDCYNVAKVTIGSYATVSQKAYLCTASHDISDPKRRLIIAPIVIEDTAWVASDAFVGMGVTIGEGAVVGARAAVFKDVPAWTVVGGNPAKYIKDRIINKQK